MNRFIIIAAAVVLGSSTFVSESYADQQRAIRRHYEARRVGLGQEYRARREANKYAYHRQRDLLNAERDIALRIDCHETRALRVRSINRELAALSRSYHLSNREITAWYHGEKDALRTSFEIALRETKRLDAARPVVASRVINRPVHTHPAGCECNICVRPIVGALGGPSERGVIRAAPLYDDYDYRSSNFGPAHHTRNARRVDWTSLLIGLLDI